MKESETLEFKESLTQLKKAIISIVSILNKHKKGKIIFGLKDDGKVVGVSIGKTTLRDISKTISDHIEPKIFPIIKEELIQEKKCISVKFSGEETPYFAYGRAYKRVSDEDKVVTKSELEKMMFSQKKIFWDCLTNVEFEKKDISDKKLKDYVTQIGLKYLSKEDALEKLELINNGLLTNAAIILFGKKVGKEFKYLNLRCATFLRNDNKTSPIDMSDFKGDIFEMIAFAENYILEHINIGMRIEGLKRIDVPEINREAFREAIINAFCHRDYSIPQEVSIAVYRDKVQIRNPGVLIEDLTIKDIMQNRISKRRNPLIANILHRIHYVENWGMGIKKIRELEPKTKFEIVGGFFNVTFQRKSQTTIKQGIDKFKITKKELMDKNISKQVLLDYLGKGWEKVGKRLGINQLKIIIVLSANNEFTIKQISDEIGVSTTAIENSLRKLKSEGILKREGGRKQGSWEVINNF